MIRLITTDMDGTLLNSRKEVPADFIPWVEKHQEVLTVLASGRQYYTLLDDFMEIKDHCVFMAENGAFIVYRDEQIHVDEMADDTVVRCLKKAYSVDEVYPILCGTKSVYYPADLEGIMQPGLVFFHSRKPVIELEEYIVQDTIIKIAMFVPGRNADEVLSYFTDLPDDVYAVVTGPEWIDIMNRTVNKGNALKLIQKRFSISAEECMGFGDLMNDYEMLQNCRYSFAMENACDGIRKIARYHTSSNDEDGVMKVLRDIERYNGGEEQT